ncbi:MAG: hypothetical protein NZ954_04360 [Thermofilaceae archaeon]|nr:hypothetical protein [Thermofilaceae archaeon]MCX8180024.1 hypothetical protein [Thermofilaceae archaeon]MDW8003233.1 hypothetical protein [Thermofilaceae archaeon]
MDLRQLIKLLGSSRVVKAEKIGDSVVLTPPVEGVTVRVVRERMTRLSTELAWVFTAMTDVDAGFEAISIINLKGFLRKNLVFQSETRENDKLQQTLREVLQGELEQLTVKARPDYIAVKVNDGVYVRVVKTLVGPFAHPLKHCYDLSWKLALAVSQKIRKEGEL